MTALAPTLQAFLTERLMTQRGASPNTVASYRDTFRLLLRFAAERGRCIDSVLRGVRPGRRQDAPVAPGLLRLERCGRFLRS